MKILVVDGQGGKIGKQLIEQILSKFPKIDIMAVGTNAIATSTMLKTGINCAATGENAVIVNSQKADIIIGPIGIAIANALYGEVTPKMSAAIGESSAKKIFIPINKCDNLIVGVKDLSITSLINDALNVIADLM